MRLTWRLVVKLAYGIRGDGRMPCWGWGEGYEPYCLALPFILLVVVFSSVGSWDMVLLCFE